MTFLNIHVCKYPFKYTTNILTRTCAMCAFFCTMYAIWKVSHSVPIRLADTENARPNDQRDMSSLRPIMNFIRANLNPNLRQLRPKKIGSDFLESLQIPKRISKKPGPSNNGVPYMLPYGSVATGVVLHHAVSGWKWPPWWPGAGWYRSFRTTLLHLFDLPPERYSILPSFKAFRTCWVENHPCNMLIHDTSPNRKIEQIFRFQHNVW